MMTQKAHGLVSDNQQVLSTCLLTVKLSTSEPLLDWCYYQRQDPIRLRVPNPESDLSPQIPESPSFSMSSSIDPVLSRRSSRSG